MSWLGYNPYGMPPNESPYTDFTPPQPTPSALLDAPVPNTVLLEAPIPSAPPLYPELVPQAQLTSKMTALAASSAEQDTYLASLRDRLRSIGGISNHLLDSLRYNDRYALASVQQRLGSEFRLDAGTLAEVRRFSYATNYHRSVGMPLPLRRQDQSTARVAMQVDSIVGSSFASSEPVRLDMRARVASEFTPTQALDLLATLDDHAKHGKEQFHQEMRSQRFMKSDILSRNLEDPDSKLAMRKIWGVTKLRGLDFKNAAMFYQELIRRAYAYELPERAASAAQSRASLRDRLREKNGVNARLLKNLDFSDFDRATVEQRLGTRLNRNAIAEIRRFSYAANPSGCDTFIGNIAGSTTRSSSPQRMEMRNSIAATITPDKALDMLVTIDEHADYRKKEFHQEMRSRGIMKRGLLARNIQSKDFKLAHRKVWAVHKLYGCHTLAEAAKYYQELKRRAWEREVEPIDYPAASTSTTTHSERQQAAQRASSQVQQQRHGSPEQPMEGVGVPFQPLRALPAVEVIHVKGRGPQLSRRNDHLLSL